MKGAWLLLFPFAYSYSVEAQTRDSVKIKPSASRPGKAIIKNTSKPPVEILREQIRKDIESILSGFAGSRNHSSTWALVKSKISDYLLLKYREGKLLGPTSQEAFYIKADQTTMTQADINSGRLIVEVGYAAVKPAEFEVLRFTKQL